MVFVLHWLRFSRGNRSQILLLWWHTWISPSRYGSLSILGLFLIFLWICVIWGKYVSLIWSYIWQEVRKCSSVSTSFCGQCAHSLSSLESQICLRQSFSIARLCSLSLYIVKFGSVTVVWSPSSSTAHVSSSIYTSRPVCTCACVCML